MTDKKELSIEDIKLEEVVVDCLDEGGSSTLGQAFYEQRELHLVIGDKKYLSMSMVFDIESNSSKLDLFTDELSQKIEDKNNKKGIKDNIDEFVKKKIPSYVRMSDKEVVAEAKKLEGIEKERSAMPEYSPEFSNPIYNWKNIIRIARDELDKGNKKWSNKVINSLIKKAENNDYTISSSLWNKALSPEGQKSIDTVNHYLTGDTSKSLNKAFDVKEAKKAENKIDFFSGVMENIQKEKDAYDDLHNKEAAIVGNVLANMIARELQDRTKNWDKHKEHDNFTQELLSEKLSKIRNQKKEILKEEARDDLAKRQIIPKEGNVSGIVKIGRDY